MLQYNTKQGTQNGTAVNSFDEILSDLLKVDAELSALLGNSPTYDEEPRNETSFGNLTMEETPISFFDVADVEGQPLQKEEERLQHISESIPTVQPVSEQEAVVEAPVYATEKTPELPVVSQEQQVLETPTEPQVSSEENTESQPTAADTPAETNEINEADSVFVNSQYTEAELLRQRMIAEIDYYEAGKKSQSTVMTSRQLRNLGRKELLMMIYDLQKEVNALKEEKANMLLAYRAGAARGQ